MGKGGGNTNPDPYATAAAQSQQNTAAARESAQLNQINQVTPYGSVEFSGAIGSPGRTQTTTLSPDEQMKLKLKNALGFGIGNSALDQLKDLPTSALSAEGINANPWSSGPNAPTMQKSLGPTGMQIRSDIPGGAIDTQRVNDPNMKGFYGDPSLQRQLDTSGLNSIAGEDDFSSERQRVEDSSYNRIASRINKDYDTQRARLEQRLADQGIPVGSDASQKVMNDLGMQRQDVLADASDRAVSLGGAEQSRLFDQSLNARRQRFGEAEAGGSFANNSAGQEFMQGMNKAGFNNSVMQQIFGNKIAGQEAQNKATGQEFAQNLAGGQFNNQAVQQQLNELLSRAEFGNNSALQEFGAGQGEAQFDNQLRSQQVGEAQNLRNQQLNELAQAMGGNQISAPNANPVASYQVAPADIAGLINQNADRNQQNQSDKLGGLSSVASAAIPVAFSDNRLKKAVVKIGELASGIGLYSYRYLWDNDAAKSRIGVMAQDVKNIIPEAVSVGKNGFMQVNYKIVFEGV